MERPPREGSPEGDEIERRAVMAIYHMYVESANKVSSWRIQTNRFFLTLLTGLFVLAWSPWSSQVVESLGRPEEIARTLLL